MENLIDKNDYKIPSYDLISRDEMNNFIELNKNIYLSKINEEILKVIEEKKNKYNKYFTLIKNIKYSFIKDIEKIIKNVLYETDILFNIKVINWLFRGTIFYIKFYEKKDYEDKIIKKFNKKIKIALGKGYNEIILNDRIDLKNHIKALCYKRNYNIIFREYGYKFNCCKIQYLDKSHKYRVSTNL